MGRGLYASCCQGNTDDFPNEFCGVGSGVRNNRPCHPAAGCWHWLASSQWRPSSGIAQVQLDQSLRSFEGNDDDLVVGFEGPYLLVSGIDEDSVLRAGADEDGGVCGIAVLEDGGAEFGEGLSDERVGDGKEVDFVRVAGDLQQVPVDGAQSVEEGRLGEEHHGEVGRGDDLFGPAAPEVVDVQGIDPFDADVDRFDVGCQAEALDGHGDEDALGVGEVAFLGIGEDENE